ncbi:MAG: sigma-70 family RNA polymerase sigma factor [Verrucomicrobiota bacterium]
MPTITKKTSVSKAFAQDNRIPDFDGLESSSSSISQYLKSISSFELLTPALERQVGINIQAARRAFQFHVRRSGFIARRMAESALLPTSQKRIGSRGNSREETLSHVSGFQAAIADCQQAYTRGTGFESAYSKLDTLCEAFPLKPQMYLEFLQDLEAMLNVSKRGEATTEFCHTNWMTIKEADEHLREARRLEKGWIHARNIMVNANLRLVVKEAKNYQSRGLSFEDLIQVGNQTLIAAADSFDPARGCRFSTHAMHHLKGDLKRAIDNSGRLIRIPVHACETIRKIESTERELLVSLGGTPSLQLLSDTTGISAVEIQELMCSKQTPISLHEPTGEDSRETLESVLADKMAWDPSEEDRLEAARQRVMSLIGVLTDTERQVILLSFGLNQGALSSEEEITSQLGLKKRELEGIKERAIFSLRLKAQQQKQAA